MRVYHYIKAEHAISNLRHRHIKVSERGKVNDPLEFLAYYSRDPEEQAHADHATNVIGYRFGFCCFSKRNDNAVMWSKYADCHRGICLGFDIPDHLSREVPYIPERIETSFSDRISDSSADSAFRSALISTKLNDWIDEEEVRVFTPLMLREISSGPFFQSFDDQLVLREIILGAECPLAPSIVLQAVGDYQPHILFQQAYLSTDGLVLRIESSR